MNRNSIMVIFVVLIFSALALSARVVLRLGQNLNMPTPTPTWTPTLPYMHMFTLTPFPPTATPSIRPIPPLLDELHHDAIQPIPSWLKSVSPSADRVISLDEFEHICITPTETQFPTLPYPPLLSLFQDEEPVRNYLYIEVNGVVPSELTWQNIIMLNSSHLGTAWAGIRTYHEFCWPADIATGTYEINLYYPTESGQEKYTWRFMTTEDK